MFLVTAWYKKSGWLYLLWPLALLFQFIASVRRFYWLQIRRNSSADRLSGLPVIVVGNITAGGTGKTPFVIALGKMLQQSGMRVGVISRGYGGKAPHSPFRVTAESSPAQCGDEAVLIARNLQCPVLVDVQRSRALSVLAAGEECDVVISDDGLQHYAMVRAMEIAIIDGARGLGNRLCLPAGPLREPPSRLQQVDHVVINGGSCTPYQKLSKDCTVMQLRPLYWINVRSAQRMELNALPSPAAGQPGPQMHAVAGIGNPQRFFSTLSSLGYDAVCHPFPDHHGFTAADLQFGDNVIVVMTEKDAVKCAAFAGENCWYLAIEAQLEQDFALRLTGAIEHLRQRYLRETGNGS
jgi:tetraacyldisaccharide 4'-kinase